MGDIEIQIKSIRLTKEGLRIVWQEVKTKKEEISLYKNDNGKFLCPFCLHRSLRRIHHQAGMAYLCLCCRRCYNLDELINEFDKILPDGVIPWFNTQIQKEEEKGGDDE